MTKVLHGDEAGGSRGIGGSVAVVGVLSFTGNETLPAPRPGLHVVMMPYPELTTSPLGHLPIWRPPHLAIPLHPTSAITVNPSTAFTKCSALALR